jgi:NAD(P)H-nitrite reductase large subunit
VLRIYGLEASEKLTYSSEKLMKLDAKRREYDITVIGEEPYVAYNRVALTSFFEHRDVEKLYMQPEAWVSLPHLIVMSTAAEQS